MMTEDRSKLTEVVNKSLQQAEKKMTDIRKRHDRVLMTTIVSSGASTLIAGITAAVGEAAKIGTEGWRIACIIAAVFGFLSTISSGIGQQQNLTDRLSEGKSCVSRLKYLNAVITTGSKTWTEISKEFEDLTVSYPEMIG